MLQGPHFLPHLWFSKIQKTKKRGFWRSQCISPLVAHALPDFLFCPWAHEKFFDGFSVVPILLHGLFGNPSTVFFFFFPEAQEHWTLEVFFGVVCDTGC